MTKLCAFCGWYQAIHGGTLFLSPQTGPQSLKGGGSYLSDGIFCPDIDFCDVFNFPITKDTLAERVLGIDCELRKGNVRSSFMRISVSITNTIEAVYKEDECITDFESSFILHIKGFHMNTIV